MSIPDLLHIPTICAFDEDDHKKDGEIKLKNRTSSIIPNEIQRTNSLFVRKKKTYEVSPLRKVPSRVSN